MIVLIRISLTAKSVTGARTQVICFRCGFKKQEEWSGESRKKNEACTTELLTSVESGVSVLQWPSGEPCGKCLRQSFKKGGEGSLNSQDSPPWSNGNFRGCPNPYQFIQAEPAPTASGKAWGRNKKQEDKPKGDWTLEILCLTSLAWHPAAAMSDSAKGVLQGWKGICYNQWTSYTPSLV